MRTNTAKTKLASGGVALGYMAKLGSPVAAEILSTSGVDVVSLDGQHGSWGPESLVQGLIAICAGPAVPMARVASNNYMLIGQLLDAGALGLIVPLVDTAEQARAAASAVRYPPTGDRSWGWGRASAYGEDYAARINDEFLLLVQIESVQAVANAEAILSVPGVDGCLVGPADLSLSMGFHPREALRREDHARMLERIVQACRDTGKVPGIDTGTPEPVALRVQQGFRFILVGADSRFLEGAVAAGVRTAQAGLRERSG